MSDSCNPMDYSLPARSLLSVARCWVGIFLMASSFHWVQKVLSTPNLSSESPLPAVLPRNRTLNPTTRSVCSLKVRTCLRKGGGFSIRGGRGYSLPSLKQREGDWFQDNHSWGRKEEESGDGKDRRECWISGWDCALLPKKIQTSTYKPWGCNVHHGDDS